MFPGRKRSSKKSRIRTQHYDPQIFHLSESQRATTAKNQLLFLNYINEKFDSTCAFNQTSSTIKKYINQHYDSWEGQKIKNGGKKDDNRCKQQRRHSSLCIKETGKARKYYHSHVLRSADLTSLKKRNDWRNQPDSFRKSIVQINSNSLGRIPSPKNETSSLKTSSRLTKRNLIKNMSAQSENNIQAVTTSQKANKQFLSFDIVGDIHQQNGTNLKGALRTSFKQKSQKKQNWMNTQKFYSKISKINQFKPSNSPIKKQIDRIITLLQEESKHNKLLSYL